MRSVLWWIGAASLALWIAAVSVYFGTLYFLPRYSGGPRMGCYLTDALLVYVECAPDVFAGRAIAFVSNMSWWLVMYTWALVAPSLFSGHLKTLKSIIFAAAWLIGAGTTLTAAVLFVLAQIVGRLRNR